MLLFRSSCWVSVPVSLAYSIYTFTSPHPLPLAHSESCLPCSQKSWLLFSFIFFFLADYRQGLRWTARSSSAAAHTHVQIHTHRERGGEREGARASDGGWQSRHAACAYILLFIFYFILYYAFCALRLSLPFCLQFLPFLFCSHIRSGLEEAGQPGRQAVGLELSTLRALSALRSVHTLLANLMCTHCCFSVGK